MSISITDIIGDRYGQVDGDDRERATEAAQAVCDKAGATPRQAETAYWAQWQELDDESGMTGYARVWIEARQAADTALTSTWAKPGNVTCSLTAD